MRNITDILVLYRSGKASKADLKYLYDCAKEQYYNGVEMMSDYEFDELEEKLGLSNKSYVGTKHNPKYTVQHPFAMGSLSKVQIKYGKNGGNIDWTAKYGEVMNFIPEPKNDLICTPKYDGCSFEAVVNKGKIVSISSRGDGAWGKDYYNHLKQHISKAIANVSSDFEFVFRGEVLIDKDIFSKKYSEFVNPRSFVSGILNRDYDDTVAEICNDLSIIIYDTRYKKDNTWIDTDWTGFMQVQKSKYGYIDAAYLPGFHLCTTLMDHKSLETIYEQFDKYRKECKFALDGIVLKPVDSIRINNLTEHRPTDCVAIKFIPMLEETEVVNIEWNLGKSEEYTPIIVTKPVIMDGKTVTRAKANNIGYLMSNKISIGTKLVLSLAGDIIPFIYKITDTSAFDESNVNLPENTYIDGIHVKAVLTDDERSQQQLRNSMLTLNIPGVGGSVADAIVEYMKSECKGDDFFEIESKPLPNNVFLITPDQFNLAIGGKTGENIRKAYANILMNIDLKTIICSCNFKLCGSKVAEQVAAYLMDQPYSFVSMAKEGYEWCMRTESKEMQLLDKILAFIGYSIDDFKKKEIELYYSKAEDANKIPVILTGEPNNYATKAEFLSKNPQYRNTTKWSECQIVFTNSLESNTGKMKQARAKGIDIRLY